MASITIKGWGDFQHYKQRNPPWIKLHKKLLDNYDFHRLPVASRALAPMLWLLASETEEGAIEADLGKIAFRLRMQIQDVADAIIPLINGDFLAIDCDASALLASCRQHAMPEREKEAEKDSVAKATDATASHGPINGVALSLKERIWGPALEWMVKQTGKSEAQLRPMMGKWCSDYGEGQTIEALEQASRNAPLDPVPYIQKILKKAKAADPNSEINFL
jgi:hypothetical protein